MISVSIASTRSSPATSTWVRMIDRSASDCNPSCSPRRRGRSCHDRGRMQGNPAAAALDLFDQHVAAMARAFPGGDFDAGYYTKHRARFEKTLGLIPPGAATSRALEIGATAFLQVALKRVFGYGEVIGTERSTSIEHKIYCKPIEV